MTVIRPNSITGVTSITAQGTELTLHRSDGSILDELKSNINASSGVSTIANLDGTNINASGIVTAASFVGDGSSLTGVASTDNINTDTLAQFNGAVGIADSIFHIGDVNTAIRFRTNDVVTVETGGEERTRVTATGLGIGTDNPSRRLHVDSGSTDTAALFYSSDAGVYINFQDSTSAASGVTIGGTGDDLRFGSGGGGEFLRITSSGDFVVAAGATFGASVGVVTYYGDGSQLSGISVGITTTERTGLGNTTIFLDLSSAQHHTITLAAGISTIDCTGGAVGESHSVVLINPSSVGTGVTVGFATDFLFPSGSSPALPTGANDISLVSFVVKQTGIGGTQVLASAGLDYQ